MMHLMEKKEIIRTIKYTCIAASAGVIQIGTYTLFLSVFKWSPWVSYLPSLILSVLWNFSINRKYTFKSAASVPKAMLLVFAYYLVFTPLSTLWTKWFTETLLWNAFVVEIGTIFVNFVTEFLWQRLVVFRGQIDNREPVKKA